VSTSVLTQRLGELREAGIVEVDAGGAYGLTARGRDLTAHVLAMNDWATRYLPRSSPSSRTARKAS
jgi:DNA-binding HxlR family transcriptional regulator